MNKQSIDKLKLFFMGIENRFLENEGFFKGIKVVFKAGLKEFVGEGIYSNGNISYNFQGVTKDISFKEVLSEITSFALNYEKVKIIYSERGSDIEITADSKNVQMKNIEVKEDTNKGNKTSTILNRNYYIKADKAKELLKAIDIMSKDGKIKNDKVRKYNQIDHYVELLDDLFNRISTNKVITILDCGCGKSYLSFVLNYYLTEVKKRKCKFIGIDYKVAVIETSKKMAEDLGYRNMDFFAMDIKDFKPKGKIDVVLSLHACDTATDMAIALGLKVKSSAIVAVPCCHRELLSQYSYKPFNSIIKHGVLKSRMADVLTEGMRSTYLEAKGYDVSIIEYISPLETPKNLMIRALKTKKEDQNAMAEYIDMMASLSVYPSLYSYAQEFGVENY